MGGSFGGGGGGSTQATPKVQRMPRLSSVSFQNARRRATAQGSGKAGSASTVMVNRDQRGYRKSLGGE